MYDDSVLILGQKKLCAIENQFDYAIFQVSKCNIIIYITETSHSVGGEAG